MILSANILALLCAQYSHEIANAVAYHLLSSWAEMRGLTGTAHYFGGQAVDELKHAELVMGYIHDRNEQLAYRPTNVPAVGISTFLDAFRAAQDIERATTDAIYGIKAQAEAEGDHATCAWLFAHLIPEQVEEENGIQTIIDRIMARTGSVPALAGSSDGMASDDGAVVHDIDVWIGSRA